MMKILCIITILISIFLINQISANNDCFRAAVLDHVHQSKSSAKENLELNLKVYEDATELAKENGVDIVVFPENGLLYQLISRNQASELANDIPKPSDVKDIDLCTIDSQQIINRLSCLAQKHKIFIAANLIDRKSCHEMDLNDDSKKCPRDKRFLFNTAILLDRNGKLIAKYHKMHLFFEFNMNPPPKPELIVVDTELGRLSLQICFDMIFDLPGHKLANDKKFDTMIFPTWWFDEAPFLSSSQYQMAWAFGNNVTLLASNIHRTELGSRGSGIYIGSTKKFANTIENDAIERLVIANVPKSSTNPANCNLDPKIVIVPQQINEKNETKYNHKNIDLKNTKFIKINLENGKMSECHNGVCCTIEYELDDKNSINNIEYKVCQDDTNCNNDNLSTISKLITDDDSSHRDSLFLFVTNRTRSAGYPWTEEFCSIVTCSDLECRDFSSNKENLKNLPKFKYLKLTAEFSSETIVYPSVLDETTQLIHPDQIWRYSSEKLGDKQTVVLEFGDPKWTEGKKISVLALYGRVYQRDPVLDEDDIRELEEKVKKERKNIQM